MTDPKPPRAETASAIDLPAEATRRIDDLYAQLGTIDHYALLGVGRSASRAEIRSAFLRAAPAFHPDRYFGKKLGGYAEKMQRIFGHMSIAHDALVDDRARAAYDETLPVPAEPAAPPRPAPSMAPAPSGAEQDRVRAQALAARLGGSPSRVQRPPSAAPPAATPAPKTPTPARPPAPSIPAIDPRRAADALRRRYEERLSQGRPSAPAPPAAADTRAREQLLEQAMVRARDAEVKKDFTDAAIAWARAFDLLPSAEVAHRAAIAFRRAGSDPRRGVRYGEEAVKLDPGKAAYRVTLAQLYAEAGLPLRARGEMERAQALEPGSPLVKEALARLKGR